MIGKPVTIARQYAMVRALFSTSLELQPSKTPDGCAHQVIDDGPLGACVDNFFRLICFQRFNHVFMDLLDHHRQVENSRIVIDR